MQGNVAPEADSFSPTAGAGPDDQPSVFHRFEKRKRGDGDIGKTKEWRREQRGREPIEATDRNSIRETRNHVARVVSAP